MQQLLRVQNFSCLSRWLRRRRPTSTGRPFGHADPGRVFAWAGATASWPNRTEPGGTRGLDDYFTRDFSHNIGAEIMGRNKFGPQRGPWADHAWQGWWGDEPPFHTPVFVLTHHPRPSFTLADTTFHFVAADPAEVLIQAGQPRTGRDVRLGGGGRPSGRSSTPTWSTPCTSRSPGSSGRGRRLGAPRGARRPVPPRSSAERQRCRHHLFWRP